MLRCIKSRSLICVLSDNLVEKLHTPVYKEFGGRCLYLHAQFHHSCLFIYCSRKSSRGYNSPCRIDNVSRNWKPGTQDGLQQWHSLPSDRTFSSSQHCWKMESNPQCNICFLRSISQHWIHLYF